MASRTYRRRSPKVAGLKALEILAEAMSRHRLEAVLIGSAALALHGVPVQPKDFDFLWRDSPAQRRRLEAVAAELGAVLTRPYFKRGLRWRLTAPGLVADFVCALDGFRDPRAVLTAAEVQRIGEVSLRVARQADVLRSKRAAGRPSDRALLSKL